MSIKTKIKFAYFKIITHFQRFLSQFQSETEDNVTIVVHRAFLYHRIKVTYSTISEYLKTHPDYPSFKSICDFFEDNNVQSYPLKYDESDLYELNYPFIAHLKDAGGKIIFVFAIDKEFVIYSDSLKWKKVMRTSEFLTKWDGAVIVLESTESSGEKEYREKRQSEIVNASFLPAIILIFTLVLVYGMFTNKSILFDMLGGWIMIFLIAHFSGLIFSIILFRHELNLKTRFTDKLCNLATNIDCDAVTKSRASKIFGSISWADAGLIYFSAGLIILFSSNFAATFKIVLFLSIGALPYSVFSILYQWLKIKKWCPFCLSVQFIIILEAAISLGLLKINSVNLMFILPVIFTYSIVFIAVLMIKYLTIYEGEKNQVKQELLKLKREPEIFFLKLRKGKRIEVPINKNALIFGDKQSNISVSVFLSFNCSACAKKFTSVLKLIQNNNKIKVQLIFSRPKDENSNKFLRKIYLLMISGQKNEILKELSVWYETKKGKKGKKGKSLQLMHVNEDIADLEEMLEYNKMLFNKGMVIAVPSIYINGFPIPMMYDLNDIKYHSYGLNQMQY